MNTLQIGLRPSGPRAWQLALTLGAVLALAGCEDDSPSAGAGGTSAGEGGSAGAAGTGGTGGMAGSGGTGGTAGDAGTGGTAGDAGTGGTAGDAGTGGTAGDAGTGGTAGDAGTGGTAGDAGTGGTSPCEATIPTTWDNTNFDTNAAAELVLRGQLQALNTRMQQAEVAAPPATVLADLTALFEAGEPSLKDAMTTSYATVVEDIFDLFIPTVGATLDPAVIWNPTPAESDVGGRLCGPSGTDTGGCWGISAGGVDLRQIMEKGAFQAALYHQAYVRASGAVTPATIDQIAALFGANADFDVDGTNIHASNYAKGMGFYGVVRGHLIAAKAYAEAGETCEAELDASLAAALRSWEESQYARFIYYAERAFALFTLGTATEAQNAEALHWLGEGLGLAYGFYGLPTDARVITDEEIEEILTLMKMPSVGAATLYRFRVGEADDLEDIVEAFDVIQDVYDFTDTQMETLFRVHPTTQG